MDIKINPNLKTVNASTIGFYNYILRESSNINSATGARITLPNACELLKTIAIEFDQLHEPDKLAGFLQILHLTIENEVTPSCNYSDAIKDLLIDHSKNDGDYLIAAQVVYQVLNSIPSGYPIRMHIFSKFLEENHENNSKLQTQLALCTVLLIEKFQVDGLLEKVWDQILLQKSYCLLVHFIDLLALKLHIFDRTEFWKIIEKLLSAQNRDDRRLGIFLIRKILKFLSANSTGVVVSDFFNWSTDLSHEILTSWLTYLTILENLEEKQSHLILPSLETLDGIRLSDKSPWIRIVLRLVMSHSNTLILRWCVSYLYRNFTNLVLEYSILEDFFNATNHTWLFCESLSGCFQLPQLSVDSQKRFLEIFPETHWKSVPIHAWLKQMQAIQWHEVDSKLIIRIATRLRQLQNRLIRSDCRSIFTSIFGPNIHAMELRDFTNLLDALFSSSDCLPEDMLNELLGKLEASSQPFISCNVCGILRNQRLDQTHESTLIKIFDKIPAKDHRWFSVLAVFGFQSAGERRKFCKQHYSIDVDCSMTSLEEFMSENVSKLSWDDAIKAVIRKATVDWFSSEPGNINLDNYNDLVDAGGVTTLINIINPQTRRFPVTERVLDRLVIELGILVKKMVDTSLIISHFIKACHKDEPTLLCKYVNKILDIDVTNNQLAINVFQSVLELRAIDCQEEDGRQLLIRGLLFGEPLSGDLRLELDYSVRTELPQRHKYDSTCDVRKMCLQFIETLDSSSINHLKDSLIELSTKMSLKKPRYFENSKHHRLKLRIAQALAALNRVTPSWNDYYLSVVLRENNQTNVTYIYEFIAATTILENNLLDQMVNLGNLSISGQVSMFAISFLFSAFHRSGSEFLEKLITLILPWTMGANFNTRLHAQITICHMLQSFRMDGFNYLKTAIENSLNESPNAFEKLGTDVRYNFPTDFHFLDTDPILYVTAVPEDEHKSAYLEYLSEFDSLKACRNLTLSKRDSAKEENIATKPVIEDVQRKMNPELHSEDTTSANRGNSNMIVVASLIDKLPNLGGIARTCEVLGIRNLVMDSAKHALSKEFKNLSMTAENWINISEVKPRALQEFLINKKTEGFHVVGAEQTAKSVNFMEFQFPEKCVLLLGHEKEGIPADLIAFLDFAVEIPQFGMVRSLNVHVTGALFMYEYCKQHLAVKK